MSEALKGVPTGASAVIPRLFCRSPADEVAFCVATFDAEERVRRPGPDGSLAHALITIGGAMVMIEGEWPEAPNRAPSPDGSTPVALYVYVENVDRDGYATRVEAEGYLPAESRVFTGDEGSGALEFRMKKGMPREGRLVTGSGGSGRGCQRVWYSHPSISASRLAEPAFARRAARIWAMTACCSGAGAGRPSAWAKLAASADCARSALTPPSAPAVAASTQRRWRCQG